MQHSKSSALILGLVLAGCKMSVVSPLDPNPEPEIWVSDADTFRVFSDSIVWTSAEPEIIDGIEQYPRYVGKIVLPDTVDGRVTFVTYWVDLERDFIGDRRICVYERSANGETVLWWYLEGEYRRVRNEIPRTFKIVR